MKNLKKNSEAKSDKRQNKIFITKAPSLLRKLRASLSIPSSIRNSSDLTAVNMFKGSLGEKCNCLKL